MEPKGESDRRSGADRRAVPRGGRRKGDYESFDRELREQQVDKYLRKQDAK